MEMYHHKIIICKGKSSSFSMKKERSKRLSKDFQPIGAKWIIREDVTKATLMD